MISIMHVQLAWSFGQRGAKETLLAIFVPFVLLPQLALKEDIKFTSNIDWEKEKKSGSREWADAILFALVAAFIIRTFVFEAFTIPTPSMERSLRVGDFLFVSKMSYGAKMPETPLSFPLAHHTIPLINTKSYLNWMKLDYHRLPGWKSWKRNDPMVFNFPEGDTVLVDRQNESYYAVLKDDSYANWEREFNRRNIESDNKPLIFEKVNETYEKSVRERYMKNNRLLVRPKDKKDNYIKRCVALPGQKLEVRNKRIYIDGQLTEDPPGIQYTYNVTFTKALGFEEIKEAMNNSFLGEQIENALGKRKIPSLRLSLDKESKEYLESQDILKNIEPVEIAGDPLAIFPRDVNFWEKNRWTVDNFGPITMPKRGETVQLNKDNLAIYERVIKVYEENDLVVKGEKIFINKEESNSYTFKLDHYWLMGDNRHNSLDSRFWGFVPEDHVVGKATFVWLSLDEDLDLFDGKIRWKRMFRGVD